MRTKGDATRTQFLQVMSCLVAFADTALGVRHFGWGIRCPPLILLKMMHFFKIRLQLLKVIRKTFLCHAYKHTGNLFIKPRMSSRLRIFLSPIPSKRVRHINCYALVFRCPTATWYCFTPLFVVGLQSKLAFLSNSDFLWIFRFSGRTHPCE